MRPHLLAFAATLGLATITASHRTDAFCGFYVAGADQKLFNNATMVVLMREGQIVQRGTAKDLVERPAEPFVTEFVRAQRTGVFAQ